MMSPLNRLFHHISLNADRLDDDEVIKAYVPLGPIEELLESPQSQILYGRRGTGKTHTLRTLAQRADQNGELSIYLDLRLIGSSGSLYSDTRRSLGERATYVLTDVMKLIHGRLLDLCKSRSIAEPMFEHLDILLDACNDLRVEGALSVTKKHEDTTTVDVERTGGVDVSLSSAPRLGGKRSKASKSGRASAAAQEVSVTGEVTLHLDLGVLNWALREALSTIAPRKILLILDEWSACPFEIQPYLADLLRRCFMPLQSTTLKIGAVEGRSVFFLAPSRTGPQIGIEVGSDTAASLILDQHLAGDSNIESLKEFFAELLLRHIQTLLPSASGTLTYEQADRLINDAFMDSAFEELVLAGEGNPRDMLNVLGRAAGLAGTQRIAVRHVQRAARDYLVKDKQHSLHGNPSAQERWRSVRTLLQTSKSRVFLVSSDASSDLKSDIADLYDRRLIHRFAQGITRDGCPGSEFDAYVADYGSFVQEMAYSELSARWTSPSEGAWAPLLEVKNNVGQTTPVLT